MNTIIFIVGAVIFIIFLISDVTEFKNKEKDDNDNYGYYSRHQPEEDELN